MTIYNGMGYHITATPLVIQGVPGDTTATVLIDSHWDYQQYIKSGITLAGHAITLSGGTAYGHTSDGLNITDVGISGTGDVRIIGNNGVHFRTANSFTGNVIIASTSDVVSWSTTGQAGPASLYCYVPDLFLDSTVLSVNGGARAGRININGTNQRFAGFTDGEAGAVSGGSITNGGAAATITLHGSGNYTFSSVINSNIALVKEGSGTQVLDATNNSYTGGTTINAGDLNVARLFFYGHWHGDSHRWYPPGHRRHRGAHPLHLSQCQASHHYEWQNRLDQQ